jgi:hypothetical protein
MLGASFYKDVMVDPQRRITQQLKYVPRAQKGRRGSATHGVVIMHTARKIEDYCLYQVEYPFMNNFI